MPARLSCRRPAPVRTAPARRAPPTRTDKGRALAALAAAAALAIPASASAQLSGSFSLQNDYRIRGASISAKRAAASLTVSSDFANGVYGGASMVVADTDEGPQILGHTEYLGYAHRNLNGLTWEVGADNVDFEIYPAPNFHLSYSEAYAGLSNGTFSSRVYISPNYLQEGLTTAYFEVNGVMRPNDDWRLSGHVGLFAPLAGNARTTVRKDRLDVRFDVVRRLGPTEINVGWTSAFPAAFPSTWRTGSGVVAGITAYF